jgi:hypothetical protein
MSTLYQNEAKNAQQVFVIAKEIADKPEETKRTIHETVWEEINKLPEEQRLSLLEAVEQNKQSEHPQYKQILSQVTSQFYTTHSKPMAATIPPTTGL